MDLFDLVAKITLDSSQYEKGIRNVEGDATALSSKWSAFGKVIGKVGAISLAALGAAAIGVGKLTKQSVEAYANYEQLAGGIKKLYGDASDEMMMYANEAYKTTGMSANKYMEQATGFSAALIKDLNGDASAAAKQTDVAMRAISDNFNTFGGDINMITGAFQGFARGNFTMLDNLKLGYSGSKQGMEELIADANEYAKSIGLAGDLSIDNFSDIVTAIELIQQKQGIAGTTAKESATTIEGSLNMVKAAWENLLTGIADPDADLDKLMDNLVTAIVGENEGEGLLNQIIPAIERALEGIGMVIEKAAPIIAERFPALIEQILPPLLNAATQLIAGLIRALPTLIQVLVQQMPMIVKTLASALADSGDVFVSAGATLIKKLWSGLSKMFSKIVSKVAALGKKIPSAIKKGAGNLASIGGHIISGLWSGIKAKFDSVIAKVKALASKLPKAVKKVLGISSPSKVFREEIGKNIVLGLAEGLEDNVSRVQDAMNTVSDSLGVDEDVSTFEMSTVGGGGSSLLDALSRMRIEVVSQIDGKEVSRVMAPLMSNELNKIQTRADRKLGYV